MKNDKFNEIVAAICEKRVEDAVVEQAADRVWRRVTEEYAVAAGPARLRGCADFQALIPAYLGESLAEARRLLFEDHTHHCVACRRALEEQRTGEVRTMPARPAARPMAPVWRWAMAAGVVLAAGLGTVALFSTVIRPGGPSAVVASVDGAFYRVTDQGTTLLSAGAQIGEGTDVRTARGTHAVVRLTDGSLVELNERTDLSVGRGRRGSTVHLHRGNVIVQAAKQGWRRLEVATPDCLVTVKGTIFAVSRGTKGSRVSVVEGTVKVDEQQQTTMLHAGDQVETSVNLAATPVKDEVSWSKNAAQYLALLGELSALQKKIEQIPRPGLRYQTKLAQYLPENTVIYAAIPNLGSTLAEATQMFEQRVQESAVLREWWNQVASQKLRLIVDKVRPFSEYLGDEIVVAAPLGTRGVGEPMLVAEARRPDLAQFLEQQFTAMGAGSNGPLMMIRNNLLVAAAGGGPLAEAADRIDGRAAGRFAQTPFYQRIAQAYQSGAGWLFAADLEQILLRNVTEHKTKHKTKHKALAQSGLSDVKYLVVERRDAGGKTENRAALGFAHQPQGIISWLAAPGPMGSLEFVSANASFATSFVIKNPGTLLKELIDTSQTQNADAAQMLAQFQAATGVNLEYDVAGSLGSDLTVAMDGPLVPTPFWKVVMEVYDQARLQTSIEKLVDYTSKQPEVKAGTVQLSKSQVNSRTYYALKSSKAPMEVHYTYVDSYLLAAPSDDLLTQAIQNRAVGNTLTQSASFRALLPVDGRANFSALMYQNVAAALGPLADQLKSTGGVLTPEQQKAIDALTANRVPTLIYAYSEPDRIVVATTGSLFGLNLDTLLGVTGKGGSLLPQVIMQGLRPLGIPGLERRGKRPKVK